MLFFAFIGRQFDRNIHSYVIFFQLYTNGRHVGSLADNFLILAGAVTSAQGTIVDGFEQIRFSGSVLSEKDIDAWMRCDRQFAVIAVIPQLQ